MPSSVLRTFDNLMGFFLFLQLNTYKTQDKNKSDHHLNLQVRSKYIYSTTIMGYQLLLLSSI